MFTLIVQENGDVTGDDGPVRGVQYPFSVNEKVIIKVRFLFIYSFYDVSFGLSTLSVVLRHFG